MSPANKKTDKKAPDKFEQSIKALEHAVGFSKQAEEDPFYSAGIAKTFETCLEYAWKYLKRRAIEEGLEVYSPKEAIKQAGRLGIIDNVEHWLNYLEDRNLAVHDYLGVSEEEYLNTIRDFLRDVKRIKRS